MLLKFQLKESIPLNPKYIFYWTQISKEQFKGLISWMKNSRLDGKLILPYSKSDSEKYSLGKRALELLGVEHEVTIENVVLSEENSKALLFNLGIDYFLDGIRNLKEEFSLIEEKINFENDKILEEINKISKFGIKDKAGDFIGTRMGRPEKAKLRKLQEARILFFLLVMKEED